MNFWKPDFKISCRSLPSFACHNSPYTILFSDFSQNSYLQPLS